MSDSKGTGADRLSQAHSELVAAVESLTSGEDWKAMLDVASRFHQYSPNNCFMILSQCPEASRVAGYKTWQSLGRQVRKGEHGLRIFAPIVRKMTVTDEATGEDVELRSLATFRLVSVFDVSQTEGDDLAEVSATMLTGAAPADLWDGLARQIKAAGFDLERGDCGPANGQTDFSVKTVRVRDDLAEAQACKTLCHELAHVLLHCGTEYAMGCRGRAEVEAESVAYLVCQSAGMVTDSYSLPYVASWAGGDVRKVQETAGRVITTARAILEALVDSEAVAA